MEVLAALDLVTALISRGLQMATVIRTAQAEGRTQLTADEWSSVIAADDAATKALSDAVAAAQAREAAAIKLI